MTKTHQDQVAIITGAAGGLGREFALALAEQGATVAIADIKDGAEVVAEITALGGQAYSEICDLAEEQQIRDFCARVLVKYGRCDILVNNAAYLPLTPFSELTMKTFRKFEAVNVEAPLILAQCLTPSMAANNYGRIVQIASSTLGTPMPNFTAYITTKMGSVGLTRALAAEFTNSGIVVNALSPGLTKTAESEKSLPTELFDFVKNMQLIDRNEVPQDLVGTLLFLTSKQCSFLFGQTINCDGGVLF